MSDDFDIINLADHPEYLDVCAAWNLGYWSILNTKREPSFARSHEAFATNLQRDSVPLTLLVRDLKINRPVGMGSLWSEDSDYWRDEKPWLASLFVHELYRGKGLSAMLINALEDQARTCGEQQLYLTSVEKVAPIYRKLGYIEVDKRAAPEKQRNIEYLFKKDLTQ